MINQNVHFVLINTTHPGNIGATARAIKNMNFDGLVLVAPKNYPHEDAFIRSSGAEDVLQKARIVRTFHEAISDCHLILGTSSRQRSLPIPLLTAREGAERMGQAIATGQKVAVLFGQERMGLTNEELAACHYHLMIPCNTEFASLNIAAAVQIIAYELNIVLQTLDLPIANSKIVNTENRENFYKHLEEILIEIEFIDPDNPRQLMRKLRRMFNRINIEDNEMNILRGILGMISKKIGERG